MDLESEIRELEAGPVLDALCATALGATPYFIDGLCHIPACDCWQDETAPFCVSRSWSAAGPALEWLGKWSDNEPFGDQRIVGLDFKNQNHYMTNQGYPLGTTCWYVHIEFDGKRRWFCCDSACLAIARAVCLVGLREKPDEMRAAWEALEGE